MTEPIRTSEDGQPPLGWEVPFPGCVQDVYLVGLPTDAKHFPEEVLGGWTVFLHKPVAKVSSEDGGLADPWRTKNHDALTVLRFGRVKGVLSVLLANLAVPGLTVENQSCQLIQRGSLAGLAAVGSGQLPHGCPWARLLFLFPLRRGHFKYPQTCFNPR